MRRFWKPRVTAMLQACTSSMTTGFRLTVYKDDSFHIEDGQTLKVRITAGSGGSIERELSFDEEKAEVTIQPLPLDRYTLSLRNAAGEGIDENGACVVRGCVADACSEGNQLRLQLTQEQPWLLATMTIFTDVSELNVHVLERGAQGQQLPQGDAVYQYELVSKDHREWVELNACNRYEALLTLPKGDYTVIAQNEDAAMFFDDAAITGAFTLEALNHSLTVIEQRQTQASMQIRVFVMEEDCVLTTPQDCYFQVEVSGSGFTQTLNLNEMNDFTMRLYDLGAGYYTVQSHSAPGYTIVYEIDGEAFEEGEVEVVEGVCRSVNILYQRNDVQSRRSLRVQKRIRGEGGCLMTPRQEDHFVITISGCGSTHSFYLSNENHFCVELADLCPGVYRIEEQETQGYVSSYQLASGEAILDGCVEITACAGADVWIINEAKNSGNLQICKYEEDAYGNLVKPQNDACFAVRLHSFAYQEILMLKAENDYCVALQQLPKGCYDIREVGGEQVLYSVDQGEWQSTARIVIDDGRLHEVRILNLQQDQCGSVRIEKWMENEHCMLLHPQCMESFEVCISAKDFEQRVTLNAQNQWCVYVEELPYGEYLIEELYGGGERYLVNGEMSEQARITIQRDLQEVKIINPLPRSTTLSLSLRMVDCDHCQTLPDADFEAAAIVEGEDFCREVVLKRANRWQAILTGMEGVSFTVTQKDTMGYHVFYEVDGQLCTNARILADGKEHSVVLVNQYRCHEGMVCVEKKLMDGCGALHEPGANDSYAMMLSGCGLEIPFTLNAQNGFCVCFDDLGRGTYEIRELQEAPCCWRVNAREQETGRFTLGTQDVHIEVVNALAASGALHITYRDETQYCEEELRFALIGEDLHRVFALAPNETLMLSDLQAGTYEIVTSQAGHILFEINGCTYEKGRIAIDQEDVFVVAVREQSVNELTLCWRLEMVDGTFALPSQGSLQIAVESGSESQQVILHEANGFTHTLYQVPCGRVCIRAQGDEDIQVKINGEQMEKGCFWMQEGCYEALLLTSSRKGSLMIDGSCQRDGEYHECTQETMRLCLRGKGVERTIVLSPDNHWSVVLERLPKGRYTLRSQDQTICFYADEVQSYNIITLEVGDDCRKVQAVLCDEKPQPQVSFRIQVQDAAGNVIKPQTDAVFTARVIGTQFFETLVFNSEQQFAQTRTLPCGRYEMFVNGPNGVLYDHTLIDGVAQTIVQTQITADTQIVFVFVQKPSRQGVLYVQGYRRDSDCDCFKKPYAGSVMKLLLQGEQTREQLVLDEENHWRLRLQSLPMGVYTLQGEDGGRYSYVVDGKESAQARFTMDQDAHNVKVIDEGEGDHKGTLILEAWQWDGEHKEKPQGSVSYWVDVDQGKRHWELLLNEGSHWLGMLEHLPEGVYQIHAPDEENVWYQVDGQTPSQEGLAVVNGSQVHVDLLFGYDARRMGSIVIEKRLRHATEFSVPTQGSYVFLLSRPGFEEKIVLNEENGYRQEVRFLEDGTYVLDEQGEESVTYRVDGGSERDHALITVAGDAHTVIAINQTIDQGQNELEVIGEGLTGTAHLLLQKAGVEIAVELSAAGGYRQLIKEIESGRYSLFAQSGCYLYQLDGQSKRHHCTITFSDERHTVIVTPCEEELEIPVFAQNQPQPSGGTLHFQLWERDDQGHLRTLQSEESVTVTLHGEREAQVTLSKDNDYQAKTQGLAYGTYRLSSSIPCLFQVEGGSEQRMARVEVQSDALQQINVIVPSTQMMRRQTTRLVL